MNALRVILPASCLVAAIVVLIAALAACTGKPPYPRFEPTPMEIVHEMLKLARVGPGDVLYDLGSGDGRIPIAAVNISSADRAVGVELDDQLLARAEQKARDAGVADRVTFVRQDLFESDIAKATVVTLYLLPETNLALRPKLLRELKPGTHIVSHSHDMGDWAPDRTLDVEDRYGKLHRLYLWRVP